MKAPCGLCGMPTSVYSLGRHQGSRLCQATAQRGRQREQLQQLQAAQGTRFFSGDQELEMVHQFRYLGRPLSEGDSDWPALYRNLTRARMHWARFSKLLRSQSLSPRVAGLFYLAVVETVLLYGSESWVWSDSMVKAVEGFHNRIVRRLANRMPRLADGEWHYPPISEAFQIVRIMPIQHYINARRATLRQQVMQRPIWRLCRNTPRTPGSSNHKMWWEQDMVEPSPLEALLSDEVSTRRGTSL